MLGTPGLPGVVGVSAFPPLLMKIRTVLPSSALLPPLGEV
jgi:hypothetical protein